MPEYDIWHMMIDRGQQGKGYRRAAIAACLDYIRTKPFGDSGRVALTCNTENAAALRIYHDFGFKETGNSDEDEIELALDLG